MGGWFCQQGGDRSPQILRIQLLSSLNDVAKSNIRLLTAAKGNTNCLAKCLSGEARINLKREVTLVMLIGLMAAIRMALYARFVNGGAPGFSTIEC